MFRVPRSVTSAAVLAVLTATASHADDASSWLRRGLRVAQVDAESPPFQSVVALYRTATLVCSGTVIAPGVVLTARHCLPVTHVGVATDAGLVDSSSLRPVTARHLPPSSATDLAILSVPGISAAPVSLAFDEDVLDRAHRVVFSGFGDHVDAGFRPGTRVAGAAAIERYSCTNLRAASTGCRPGAEVVVFDDNGVDTCRGDSGGPLFVYDGARWLQVAATSRSAAMSTRPCGEGGIYTRVDHAQAWIRSFLEDADA